MPWRIIWHISVYLDGVCGCPSCPLFVVLASTASWAVYILSQGTVCFTEPVYIKCIAWLMDEIRKRIEMYLKGSRGLKKTRIGKYIIGTFHSASYIYSPDNRFRAVLLAALPLPMHLSRCGANLQEKVKLGEERGRVSASAAWEAKDTNHMTIYKAAYLAAAILVLQMGQATWSSAAGGIWFPNTSTGPLPPLPPAGAGPAAGRAEVPCCKPTPAFAAAGSCR